MQIQVKKKFSFILKYSMYAYIIKTTPFYHTVTSKAIRQIFQLLTSEH
jgi:hypothetical protein